MTFARFLMITARDGSAMVPRSPDEPDQPEARSTKK